MQENNLLMKQGFRLMALIHRYQMMNYRQAGPFGNPHRGQGRVLTLLKLQPEITQKELGYLLDMRTQSLGELLMKLEKNGFITRTPSESDRRVMLVRLTEQGKEAANDLEKSEKQSDHLIDCLSEEEQKTLGEYMERMIDELEKRLSEQFGEQRPAGEPPFHPGFAFGGARGPSGFGGFDPMAEACFGGRPPHGGRGPGGRPFGPFDEMEDRDEKNGDKED